MCQGDLARTIFHGRKLACRGAVTN